MTEMWMFRADVAVDNDLVGYQVEAADGDIGRIDETSREAGAAYLVVDTGFWIFGKRRLIPAAAVSRVDDEEKKIHVGLTKEQIESAPDFDEEHRDDRAAQETYFSANVW